MNSEQSARTATEVTQDTNLSHHIYLEFLAIYKGVGWKIPLAWVCLKLSLFFPTQVLQDS